MGAQAFGPTGLAYGPILCTTLYAFVVDAHRRKRTALPPAS